MTSRRVLAGLTVGAFFITMSACSSDQASSDTLPPTTTAIGDTTIADTVESSTTASTSTVPPTAVPAATTTTIPAVQGLELSAQGLGDVIFGADADQTVVYVNSVLGKPTRDTGWVDPLSTGGSCPGTTIRLVDWNDLQLFFTDNSPAVQGLRHFASFSYGPAVIPGQPSPFGLVTGNGIGLGSTVKDLKAAYPAVQILPGDALATGPQFVIEQGLHGFLTGVKNADTVISFIGGYGCGE
jgi:hypothetical protein